MVVPFHGERALTVEWNSLHRTATSESKHSLSCILYLQASQNHAKQVDSTLPSGWKTLYGEGLVAPLTASLNRTSRP